MERDRELAALDALLDRGGALVIEGGAGIGKTALAAAAAAAARQRGWRVLRGCGSGPRAEPPQPSPKYRGFDTASRAATWSARVASRGSSPSSSSRATMASTLAATRAWNDSWPLVPGMTWSVR